MWVTIPQGIHKEYFINYCNVDSGYTFYITNLINIWEKHYTQKDFLGLIQDCNPLLEADDAQLISQCLDMLFDCLTQSKVETSINFQNETKDIVEINIKTLRGKFPFKIKLECRLSTTLKFYEEITLTLIQTIKELKASEKVLFELLNKKDAEIHDYKAEGAILSLKHLETNVFNQQEHQQLHTPSCNYYFNFDELQPASKEVNTPFHLGISTKNTAISSVKKELKQESQIDSSASSPIASVGFAPSFDDKEETFKTAIDTNISLLGKRKRNIRKQLNL